MHLEKIDSLEKLIESIRYHGDENCPGSIALRIAERYFHKIVDCEPFMKFDRLVRRESTSDAADQFRNEISTNDKLWARMREVRRFRYGMYCHLDDILVFPSDLPGEVKRSVVDRLCDMSNTEHSEMLTHISINDPCKIAYTPNEEYLVQDRQVTMKMGRFFNKFFSDLLTPEQIKQIATTNMSKQRFTLQFAETREGIRWVYENGPHSCMGHYASDFETDDVHPVEAYATPDIAVAYVYDEVKGQVTARTCVNKNNNTWNRVFGEESLIRHQLEELGFSKDIDALYGCRLLRILEDDKFVGPYVDADENWPIVEYDNDYLMVHERGTSVGACYNSYNSGGFITDTRPTCDVCGRQTDSEDMHNCDHCVDDVCDDCVNTTHDDHILCDHCFNRHTITARDEDGDFTNLYNHEFAVTTRDGETYVDQDCAEQNGHMECEECQELVRDEEILEVTNEDNRAAHVCDDCRNDDYITTADDVIVHENNHRLHTMPDGAVYYALEAAKHDGYSVVEESA